ncbi:ANTAR domain-containing protein [Streptomyces dangxiongensis]|uniref:ANTAR domain-containing protein n=1 Tax=Streptomyces dangxiongensis TaxID=1442032 RepID=A0A3G2J988_9ACTN|nr:GAF and ANTAR domain-containing protein [Streptomyces dangxiongensis]AYN38241.1 ANTAR domain-containing protein [Streptomyces dangxiongensis]
MTEQPPLPPDVASLLLSTDSVERFLEVLADRAQVLAPAAQGAGITLERQGRHLTVAGSGAGASDLDEAQYGQDDGPCLQALRTGEEILVTDMLDEDRWGPYPAYAAACGIRSSLSLPIATHIHTAGALNLYSQKVPGFADADLTGLRALAAQATGAIALAQRLADARQYADEVHTATESRAVIDQAIDVIMGRQHCRADEAFASGEGAHISGPGGT